MLVYGDQPRAEDPRAKLAAVAEALSAGKHTHALIEAGELAQGLADLEFETLGHDEDTALQRAALALCMAIAKGGSAADELGALSTEALPPEIRCKTPEGYAFYALFPESYAHAAASCAWSAPPFVIGLRSIGASLAAVVAAASGAQEVITVRPTGHPFRRELRLAPSLRARLADHRGPFAVVDEGPGLSGSSFGAVADCLEALGVAEDRIVFLPGHRRDLGPQASPEHRARWARAMRLVGDAGPSPATLFADLIGQVLKSEDIAGSVWKVRLETDSGAYVARFAGLGSIGERKLERAQALHAAGFAPEPIALRRGMLLQRWVDAEPGPPTLEHLSRYLAFRRRAFPAPEGGSSEALKEMARVNTGELLGKPAGRAVAALIERLPIQAASPCPVYVDGRLHSRKWLRTAYGFAKLDGLDHSQAHDLVGPQDIAWDVAGAEVELGLTREEAEQLAQDAGADPVMLSLFRICYPAFQAGLARFRGEDEQPYRRRLCSIVMLTEAADNGA